MENINDFHVIITHQKLCSMIYSAPMQTIKNFFEAVLSLILPKDAGIAEIESMSEAEIAEQIPRAPDCDGGKYQGLFHYKDPVARKAIWEIKYKGNKKIGEKFSKLLYEFIIEEIADEAVFANFTRPLLIPIPASRSTLKARGFNQCELIVKEMGKVSGKENFEIDFNALKKIKDTPHQSKLKNRAERLENLRDSFGASEKVKGRNIIVIDDVITTGATMREAMKTLRKAGAKKVIGFAIAH